LAAFYFVVSLFNKYRNKTKWDLNE
jgi:hypothetical protein